ncbi:MAG: hypothetical protein HKO99_02100 [Xanthomonadales bacterium]|nr:hypothetical protein [Xanthomonadales bacterium]
MKKWVLVSILPVFTGCAAITADPWHWMDDTTEQRWVTIEAQFQELTISFEVPARSNGSTYQVRSGLLRSDDHGPIKIGIPTRKDYQATPIGTFHWDYWWGGFLRDSGTDFVLNAFVGFYGKEYDQSFLDVTPSEYIDWRLGYWESFFKGSDPWFSDRFFGDYEAEVYRSDVALLWVAENDPPRIRRMTDFMVPIGQDHVLHFNFFINEKSRNGLDPDPAWVERRWEMAYKILDTVEITPRPGKF